MSPRRPAPALVALATAGAVLAAGLTGPGLAAAQTERTYDYPAGKVFPTAVRFLRVNERVAITEKDAEALYVLFELEDDGKTFPGALELIVADDAAGARVRVVLRLEDRPSYLEAAMLERFERKLRAELGSPPARRPPPKAPPPKEAPKDAPKDPPQGEPGPDGR